MHLRQLRQLMQLIHGSGLALLLTIASRLSVGMAVVISLVMLVLRFVI
jgi:hypothetical protein